MSEPHVQVYIVTRDFERVWKDEAGHVTSVDKYTEGQEVTLADVYPLGKTFVESGLLVPKGAAVSGNGG